MRDAGERREAIGVEGLVARQIRDCDPEQIVEGSGNVVHLEYAGEPCDGFLERLNVAAHVTLQLHCGKDSERLPQDRRVDIGAVASNNATLLQVSLPR